MVLASMDRSHLMTDMRNEKALRLTAGQRQLLGAM